MAKLLVMWLLILACPAFAGNVSDAMEMDAPTDFTGGLLTRLMCVAASVMWCKSKIEDYIYERHQNREHERNRLYHKEQRKLKQEAAAVEKLQDS